MRIREYFINISENRDENRVKNGNFVRLREERTLCVSDTSPFLRGVRGLLDARCFLLPRGRCQGRSRHEGE